MVALFFKPSEIVQLNIRQKEYITAKRYTEWCLLIIIESFKNLRKFKRGFLDFALCDFIISSSGNKNLRKAVFL